MLACFLLLAHHLPGPSWAPLVAMPVALAGIAASLFLFFSGVSGYIATEYRERKRRRRAPKPLSLPALFGSIKPERR